MKKLAIVTTHPIQYHVPWLIRLAEKDIVIKVFYTYEQSREGTVFDPGFGKPIQWDIPLLEGYEYEFVANTSRRPGLDNFRGIVNPDLIQKVSDWRPEGLLVIGWNYHSHLQCMRYFHGRIPVYFRGDSVLLHEKYGLRMMARRIFLTWVYRNVDYALYVGANNKSYYLRHGMRPAQLIFSPQAIDIERFSSPDDAYRRQAERWRLELKIPHHHLTVLFAGKLTPVKNPSFVLRLAEACRNLPITFIIVGEGQLREDLIRAAEDKPNIRFMDFQNQSAMPSVYRMGDLYIMPSLSETWGMGINEAMACGIPIMASEKVGCAADLVLENRTGITFPLSDIGVCVSFLQYACANRNRLKEMGKGATALIQFFSFSQIVDSVVWAMGGPMEPSRHNRLSKAI
jgi:glycosyltransferase involved in cell wall biosynthesis